VTTVNEARLTVVVTAGDAAGHVTGVTLDVNGGRYMPADLPRPEGRR